MFEFSHAKKHMIHEIQAKVMLAHIKQPDPWFGLKYNMNLYRGCPHQCIYCDSRSECYQIENFEDVLVKVNAVDRLRAELPRKRVKGTIGTGSMSDPYLPVERQYRLTARALEVIAEYGFPVHILTKSDLVVRDLDTLQTINEALAVVSFTITTTDDDLARKLEPGAPSPSRRLKALETLAGQGIRTGILLTPVLPFIEDNEDNVRAVVEQAKTHGASYILAAFGMTLRDRQRAYYYDQLDRWFPGLRAKYEQRYGERYSCHANPALQPLLDELCEQYGIAQVVPRYQPPAQQLSLF
ncbi:MAG TPA: radical SAM protein [Aggregatilineaceae bacterium]|nr:radical SAM protein [Aggregatilineaceae bacterium]